MAVVFEKLGDAAIEAIAEEVVGKIIEEIKDLITNKADNPIRAEFTQSHLATAARLVNEPVNVLIIFEHDHHDAKDLFAKGWKMGKLKCPCPHAGNTLLCTFLCAFTFCVNPKNGDGTETNVQLAR